MWTAVMEALDSAAVAIRLKRKRVDMWVDDPQMHVRFHLGYRNTGFNEVFLIGIPLSGHRLDLLTSAVAPIIHWFGVNGIPLRRIWDSSGNSTVMLWESSSSSSLS